MSLEDSLAAVKTQLSEEAERLRAQLTDLGFGDTGTGAGHEYDTNFADSSQVTAERGEAASLAGSLRESLADIEHALAKFELGTFGACERCGKAISEARLEAMPTSRHCIDCVSAR